MTRTREEKEKLFMDNRRLVPHILKKYTIPQHVDYDDVLQVGYMALWRCINDDGYDPSKGKPATYFCKYIETDVNHFLWKNSNSDGFEVCGDTRRQSKMADKLRRQGLTDAEIADAMNEGKAAGKRISVDRVKAMVKLSKPSDTLYRTDDDGEEYDNPKLPKVTDAAEYDVIENGELHSALEIAINKYLSDAEATVIRMRYGLEGEIMSTDETAIKIGRTPKRVNQLRNKALAKLRHPRCSNTLNDYR